MQKITEQQIKTIAKEIVKLSKNDNPIKHSSVLEVISHSLGYRDYNGLSNSLKKEDTTLVNHKDFYTAVSEIPESDKILTRIRNIEKKIESPKNAPNTEERNKLTQELTTLRRSYSDTVNDEAFEDMNKRFKQMRLFREEQIYEKALQRFNNHFYSILESASRNVGFDNYNTFINSLKIEVPESDDMYEYVDKLLEREKKAKSVISFINNELESKKNTLSKKEIQKIESNLKILDNLHKNASATIKKELKTCPNCNGEGYTIVAPLYQSASSYYNYEYGDFSSVAVQEEHCVWCDGAGKTTDKRINEVKKMEME